MRRATLEDVDLLLDHRIAMFRDMGGRTERTLARHRRSYLAWVVPKIAAAEVIAWIAEDASRTALGSGAVWFQPTHPRPGSDATRTPYVLSVYTVPAARGRGVASAVTREALRLARRSGYGRVTLHASSMGRPVYARLGFLTTSEMKYPMSAVERRRDLKRIAEERRLRG